MKRVLVVEDDRRLRAQLIQILSTIEGVEVVGYAENGLDGLRQAKRLLPDLITMDIEMPGINGLDAIREIRRNEIAAKIIMVTSLNTKDKVFEAIRHGADHYILKPFDNAKLAQTIKDCMG